MFTSYGSVVDVLQCACNNVPIPHAYVRIDGSIWYGPIHSQVGILNAVEAEVQSEFLEAGEREEVESYLHHLPFDFPETHVLDQLTPQLKRLDLNAHPIPEGVDVEMEPDHTAKGRAKFSVCAHCGKHGVLYHKSGVAMEFPRSKEEARDSLRDNIDYGYIDEEDYDKVLSEIADSTLPDTLTPQEDKQDQDDD